ncbi:autotransporter domain-containing protein [Cetobacterium sp.]|uniref:autotransporter domain-containing protein n=1 Tax=Cetobacterium sp. TaxID=2071632 RepID=UPI003F6657F7
MRVDIRKLEQFLKRNLKRKISMSVGTVICYLLTGGFAFGQDYIEVTENKVISENEVINESLKIVGEGLLITNNGVIDVFYEENNITADINSKGNAIFSENISNIQGIKNNGIISGKAGVSNNEIDSYAGASSSGNGISISKKNLIVEGYDLASGTLTVGEISNQGTISGEVELLNANSYSSGNGLLVNNELQGDSTVIEKISNNGVLVGSSKLDTDITSTTSRGEVFSGNGIFLNGLKLKVTGIENNGMLSGAFQSNSEITNTSQLSGNGILVTYYGTTRGSGEVNTEIGKILNNGVISGQSTFLSTSPENVCRYAFISGNGISALTSNGVFGEIINNGLITGEGSFEGNSGTNIDYLYISGNGIQLISTEFEGLTNKGIISGEALLKDNSMTGQYLSGNGLVLIGSGNSLTRMPAQGGVIGTISNDGITSGKYKSEQQSIINRIGYNLTNGNGMLIDGYNLTLQGILNNGVISGYSNEVIDYLRNGIYGSGNGIFIADSYAPPLVRDVVTSTIKNYGLIKGTNKGIQNLNGNFLTDNYGVIAGSVESDSINENKGVLLEIDTTGNVVQSNVAESTSVDGKNIINGTNTGVVNSTTGIISGDIYVDASNLSTKDNLIINGTGVTTGALNVNEDITLESSIINGYNTAVYVNSGKSFTGNNVIFNGGGLIGDIDVIKGDSGDNKVEILGNSIINGDVDLGAGADNLLVSNGTQINGDLFGGEGIDSLQLGNGIHNESHPLNNYDSNGDGVIDKGDWRGLAVYNSISEFENINVGGSVTLYETAKINGDTNIHIGAGGSLNLRIDPTKKDLAGRVIGHALYSEGNKTITTEKHEAGANIEDYWQNGDKGNFLKGGTLNIITNGLGIGGVIAMSGLPITRDTSTSIGSTILDPSKENLYIRTDSIIHSATVYKEGDIASYATTQAQVGDIKVTVNPDILVVPPNPDPPIEPPIKPPVYSGPRYNQLNRIYKSLIANGDNINAIYPTTSITLLSEYLNYPVQSESTTTDMALGNLLTLLNEIYTASPYSFSNELSRESMELYSDVIIDNPFKARDKEWMIYGGLLHESVDLKDRYYAKNYHGFDTLDKTTSIKADNKITGAYALGEYGINSSLSVGGILGGSKNKSDISNGSDLDGNAFYIGSYFKKDIENWRILGGIGYQYTDYDAKRKAGNMMQTFSYDNSYEDNGLNIYLSGKYNYPLGDNYYLVPKAKLAYTYIDQDGVNEGGNPLAMDIDSKKFNVFDGTIGVDLKKELFYGEGKGSVKIGVSYKRLFNGSDDEYLTARMRDGSDFDLLIPNKVKNNYSVEVGYEYENQRGVLFNLNGSYSFDVSESNTVRDNSSTKNSEKGWIIGAGIGYRFK